ncbi:Pyruvate/Phosphoenolpyruvate kinase-like domain-containing protein [Multifurca ochricompacta]|uniref:Pyruvate/Phosphoenolpyruvate kinase-like domain-containing protein n=1 Tax=Multifurca ochricompacta TaxID=376703 RepID=A0AAD4M0Z9_9AGAM|nr:Pyruvate/Phosphoenolpyruvate kinase-like domain-containing protein [Multifurca ochricompacta]
MLLHPLRSALYHSKTTAFGAWITLPGAQVARSVAASSPNLSWVTIDCEHGLTNIVPGASESILAIRALGSQAPSALVRIPATTSSTGAGWQIKHALDAGAAGVIVPMVATAAQARDIVLDSRFPPSGRRGLGSMFAHGVWGLTMNEYLRVANDGVIVIAQIETREGVDNVEEIARVDGIGTFYPLSSPPPLFFSNVLFVGPFDLSLSLGYATPSPDPHPEVEKTIQRIKTVAHAAGKKVAIFCTSGLQAVARAKEGFDMVNVSVDVISMTEHIQQCVKDALDGVA